MVINISTEVCILSLKDATWTRAGVPKLFSLRPTHGAAKATEANCIAKKIIDTTEYVHFY